jgi:hypothetical protein
MALADVPSFDHVFSLQCGIDRLTNANQPVLIYSLRFIPPAKIDMLQTIDEERSLTLMNLHRHDRDFTFEASIGYLIETDAVYLAYVARVQSPPVC